MSVAINRKMPPTKMTSAQALTNRVTARPLVTPAVRAEAAFRLRSGEVVELQPHVRMPR
jgi:hypothetical protein